MGRSCTICAHPAHTAIDAALETDGTFRDIAAQFGVSKTALHRHWQTHVSGRRPIPRQPLLWTFAKWTLVIGVGMLMWRGAQGGAGLGSRKG